MNFWFSAVGLEIPTRMAPRFSRRRRLAWGLMVVLCGAFWLLGDVPRNHPLESSPDGQFSMFVATRSGWRVFGFRESYRLYVEENSTKKRVLVTVQSKYCGFEEIGIRNVRWDADSLRFTCFWLIQGNGLHPQFFRVENKPFAVKASAACCGA